MPHKEHSSFHKNLRPYSFEYAKRNEKLNQISVSVRARERARNASIPIVTNSILLSVIIDFDCSNQFEMRSALHCIALH